VHRAENTDNPNRLEAVIEGLGLCGRQVILPLHPRTRNCIKSLEIILPANIHIVDPVGYLEMVWLENHCSLIATDSGGVQKEAYFFGKPCVTLRDETEWLELVKTGWNTLVGANAQQIADCISTASVPINYTELYGTGDAAGEVLREIL